MEINQIYGGTTRVYFPSLNVRLQVNRSSSDGKGIEFEGPINLINGNYVDDDWPSKSELGVSSQEYSERRHQICNHLQILGFSLEILQRTVAPPGAKIFDADFDRMLDMAIEALNELETLSLTNDSPRCATFDRPDAINS